MTRAQETANALDMMTASILGRKQEKASQLTPVGMERVLPVTQVVFPNDEPDEVVRTAIRNIRREVRHIEEALDAVEAQLGGKNPDTVVDMDAQQKAKEREADEKFSDRFDKLKKEAQAAVYRDAYVSVTEAVTSEWKCPKHGDSDLRSLTSRKGRKYVACGCGEFEK